MAKHPHKHNHPAAARPVDMPVNVKEPEDNYINTPPVWAWLLTTLLFMLLSGMAPVFWSASFTNSQPSYDTQHIILGVTGIFAFLIEPLVLKIYEQPETTKRDNRKTVNGRPGSLLSLVNWALLLLLAGPAAVLNIIRPVLRALLLYTCFIYLNLGGGESRLFVTVVMLDIVLYYCGMFSSKLSLPGFVVRYFNIKAHPLLLGIGTVFFIFYTALVYSFIASIGYYKTPGHINLPGEQEILLLFSWILATLYIRLPYLPGDVSDLAGYFYKIPKRYFIFQAILLAVSFIAYIWPYLRGWR